MLVWLLVLLLLSSFIYIVYRMNFVPDEKEHISHEDDHYTFKIRE